MLKIVKRKYNLYKRYKSSELDRDYSAYVKQRNETNTKIRQAQKNYKKKLINSFKTEPKKFYGYLRSKQKVKIHSNPAGERRWLSTRKWPGESKCIGQLLQVNHPRSPPKN